MSVHKMAVAVAVGAVVMFAMPSAHAQSAYSQCADLPSGQRSFCMIEAQQAQRVMEAKKQKKDVTVHYDYDDLNDTPAQAKAKKAYHAAAEKCADMEPGQQGFCMNEASLNYLKGM